MRSGGGGGGFGGMMGGMRGLHAGGMNSPNLDNLTDEGLAGSVYDNRVVMRLLTYLKPHKRDVVISIVAILIYTVGNVTVPLFMLLGIDWAINSGDQWRLHVLAGIFLLVAVAYFGAMYVQYVYHAQAGASHSVHSAHPDVRPPPGPLSVLLPPHAGWTDHVP